MKSVVIADDNHRIVELLSQLLKKHGIGLKKKEFSAQLRIF